MLTKLIINFSIFYGMIIEENIAYMEATSRMNYSIEA